MTGQFALVPILYGLAVLLWTAGFDVIYALQDVAFDQSKRLYSMPASFGVARALRLSEWMHLGTALLLVYAGSRVAAQWPQTGWLLWLGTGAFLGLLVYQHLLVKAHHAQQGEPGFFHHQWRGEPAVRYAGDP